MSQKRRSAALAAVLAGRAVGFRDLQSVLATLGFRLERIRGSHHIYVHPRAPRPLSIQPHGNEAKAYQVRQLRDMILEFGLLDESE